jgi:hypothetical protein
MEDQPSKSIFELAAELEAGEPEAAPKKEIQIKPADFDIDLTDHNPEAAAVRSENEKDGVAAPEELQHPNTRIQHPINLEDPVGRLKADIDPFSDEFDIGTVTVTPAERDAFVRSALHDEEMVFDIHLEGPDINVKVAIPTEAFTVLAANTLDIWDEGGSINAKSNVHWLLAFQQLHAWYQIREFNGKVTSWATFFDEGLPKISAIRNHLKDPAAIEDLINISAPRWRMMVNAMALAEYKYKLCLDAWRTRAFFAKADTA